MEPKLSAPRTEANQEKFSAKGAKGTAKKERSITKNNNITGIVNKLRRNWGGGLYYNDSMSDLDTTIEVPPK